MMWPAPAALRVSVREMALVSCVRDARKSGEALATEPKPPLSVPAVRIV